jgi:peptidylprolyl isomerase
MKNSSKIIVFGVCLLLAVLLFGCAAQNSSGSGLMALDKNDSNTVTDSNKQVFNNLNEFRKAQSGDSVEVHYAGRLTDGTIFDSSIGRSPLGFVIDDGGMIKGFNEAVKGMKVGETKTVTLLPKDAYGEKDPAKIITINANSFEGFSSMEVGMTVVAQNGMRGIITAKNDKNASVDFNPELAGKTLIFDITLVLIK